MYTPVCKFVWRHDNYSILLGCLLVSGFIDCIKQLQVIFVNANRKDTKIPSLKIFLDQLKKEHTEWGNCNEY